MSNNKAAGATKEALEKLKQYEKFDRIDGSHPWQKIMPEGHVNYNVRVLSQGKVAYFNFNLAKEMGLIPENHPHMLTNSLEKKLLDTFNLQIINEYDLDVGKKISKKTIKPNPYMATRYLQLQHKNKQGTTSGDGRGIWNGYFSHRGSGWDISSRGTGVTSLSPGAASASEHLETGNTEHGYGCGLAEIDELYSSALMSEILSLNGYNTERTLVLIEHAKGYGIGVRAGKNLFRPAHLFMYLKQGNYESLKKATDYIIARQVQNKEWDIPLKSKYKYPKMLDALTYEFAKFIAHLERDYIFAWLDWDGDNVLINSGIIDYGSIRQFGVRHDQYRYDDVERFSTTLNEQKNKASLIIQVFCQLTDYLQTKVKKPLNEFKNHSMINKFHEAYEYFLLQRFLFQLGYPDTLSELLMLKNRSQVKDLYRIFESLEKTKTKQKTKTVEDGINRPPIFNLRKVSTYLPRNMTLKSETLLPVDPDAIFTHMKIEDIDHRDDTLTPSTKEKLSKLQTLYSQIFTSALRLQKKSALNFLTDIKKRSQLIGSPKRVTGNSLVYIVNELLSKKRSGIKSNEIQNIMENFAKSQCLNPDTDLNFRKKTLQSNKSKALIKTMLTILDEHSEDI